jgi:hypothetical protein
VVAVAVPAQSVLPVELQLVLVVQAALDCHLVFLAQLHIMRAVVAVVLTEQLSAPAD